MIIESARRLSNQLQVSSCSQHAVDGHAVANILGYSHARGILFVCLPKRSCEVHEPRALRPENHSLMLIPPQVTVALFFFIADTFPDNPSSASVDILDLIARAQRGDREAVAVLYQLHAPKMFRYIVARVPTNADAEDLTAEVFVSMVKGLPSYQIRGAPFEAWLYRIAASRVTDFYRRTRHHVQTELPETLHDSTPLPEEKILQDQTLDHLRKSLQQLPEEYQTILILRFVERKSHEDVAELLGKSVPAVKSIQHRALIRLTELLGSDHKVRHYLRGSHD